MGVIRIPIDRARRRATTLLSVLLSLVATMLLVQALVAAEGETTAANLSGSSKSVDRDEAIAGHTLLYTIVISNSGDAVPTAVITDQLPVELTYVPESLSVEPAVFAGLFTVANGMLTGTVGVNPNTQVIVRFNATLTETLAADAMITNTVQITGAGDLLTRSAGTLIVTAPATTTIYLPFISEPIPAPVLQSTRPNSSNTWTVSWNQVAPASVTAYELQESKVPDFSSFTSQSPGNVGNVTAKIFDHTASINNVYYYRVRAIAGSQRSPWSGSFAVVGAYRDDFNDNSSGWTSRRMSYLEKTDAKYGTGDEKGRLIVLAFDKWDWVVASPLRPAPQLPYVIEYRSRVHDWSNLVSGGAVFGSDWNGAACPELGNVYRSDHCFNHFYNVNTIMYSALKLLFERVDYLYYCPGCMGSQLKRLSDDESTWFIVDPVPNVDADGWNTWRIEVRSTGIKLFANGQKYGESADTRWVHEPYFGIFASTEEYQPSIWFYDYFQVTPLDN